MSTEGKQQKSKIFTWTDEETALLLKVVLDYKTTKLGLGRDWETVRSEYEDIQDNFLLSYPKEEESLEFPSSKFVHKAAVA